MVNDRAMSGHFLDLLSRRLAGATIGDDFEGNLLTVIEATKAGALNSRNVNEHIWSALIWLNEAEAFC